MQSTPRLAPPFASLVLVFVTSLALGTLALLTGWWLEARVWGDEPAPPPLVPAVEAWVGRLAGEPAPPPPPTAPPPPPAAAARAHPGHPPARHVLWHPTHRDDGDTRPAAARADDRAPAPASGRLPTGRRAPGPRRAALGHPGGTSPAGRGWHVSLAHGPRAARRVVRPRRAPRALVHPRRAGGPQQRAGRGRAVAALAGAAACAPRAGPRVRHEPLDRARQADRLAVG